MMVDRSLRRITSGDFRPAAAFRQAAYQRSLRSDGIASIISGT